MINPAESYTIEEYLEIVRRRIWYIVIPFSIIFIGISTYAYFTPRQYIASTLILVSRQRVPEVFVQPTVTSNVEERLQAIAQQVLSRPRLERIIDEFKLYPKERQGLSNEEVILLMQKDIKIELPTSHQRGSFRISYIGHDPIIVAAVANRLASQFIEENLIIREQQAEGTTEFLSAELTLAKTKLDQLETTISRYKKQYMGELPEQRETNLRILEQLQNQYQRVGESLRAAHDRKFLIQKRISELEQASVSQATARPAQESSARNEANMSYPELQREALDRSLEQLRAKYTERHPDIVAIKRKISDLANSDVDVSTSPRQDKAVAYDIHNDPRYKELANQLIMTDLEIKRSMEEEPKLTGAIHKYRARIEHTPAREQEMASLLRDHQSQSVAYEVLLKKSQDARQAENLEKRQKGEQFRIIDPVRVPEKPFAPNIPKMMFIGLALGLACGFGLAFLREQLDRTFHDPKEVEFALGLKVLAVIPRLEGREA